MPNGDIDLKLPSMRVAYEQGSLTEADLAATWHEQLQRWLDQAVAQGLPDANAMVLATASGDGFPSSRTVLAKGLDERGVVFFTNYASTKSHDLLATRFASATFPWYGLQRQVTVRGTVEKVRSAETAEYWAQRPRGSQLGAWASPQSIVVNGRGTLESALANVERQFADAETIPVPPHWGGWRIQPQTVEFWQGRADRMHDRLRFRDTHGGWKVERLGP
ncbi:pyridoxamine 5'-phosphate oxidase [Actinokineospora pegani]|uniref:pyridoxamine 5'-phosphate oxidase n=1 Tax=Actinokineospora pegani TaxID=2654637 RepID=UPI0012E9D200|nr:pyridoxamine 5'-phosphate oxidase [Actinokineospora pegani]